MNNEQNIAVSQALRWAIICEKAYGPAADKPHWRAIIGALQAYVSTVAADAHKDGDEWKVQRSENFKSGWIVDSQGHKISKFMSVKHALMIVKNHNATTKGESR